MKQKLALLLALVLFATNLAQPLTTALAVPVSPGGAPSSAPFRSRRQGRHTRAARPRLNPRRADVDASRIVAVPYADVTSQQLQAHFAQSIQPLGHQIHFLAAPARKRSVLVVKTPAVLAAEVASALADSCLYASVDYDQLGTEAAVSYSATPNDAHFASETANPGYFDETNALVLQSKTWSLRTAPGARFSEVWPQLAQASPAAAAPVAILDSGFYLEHEDLRAANIIGKYDFGDNDVDVTPGPGAKHGTHVASILGGQTANALGYASAAYDALVYAYKTTANANSGPYASAVAAALLQAKADGARVVNMSLGFSGSSQVLEDACRELDAAGILLVAAAGNDGTGDLKYPAAYPEVISVAALSRFGTRASFSNYGSTVNLAAPGAQMGFATFGNGSAAYAEGQGTSYAAPLVSAALSLLIRADAQCTRSPYECAQHLKQILFNTTRQHTYVEPGKPIGIGMLDVKAAFDEVVRQQPPAPPIPPTPPTPNTPDTGGSGGSGTPDPGTSGGNTPDTGGSGTPDPGTSGGTGTPGIPSTPGTPGTGTPGTPGTPGTGTPDTGGSGTPSTGNTGGSPSTPGITPQPGNPGGGAVLPPPAKPVIPAPPSVPASPDSPASGNAEAAQTETPEVAVQKLRITKLKLGKRGKRRLTLKFSKVIGASKYTLRYRVKGKKAWKTTTVAGNKTSITLKRLKKAKRYQFQIKASYRLGDTSYTTSWSPRVTSRKIR